MTTGAVLPATSRLPSLTGMRFIAAFAVFGFHIMVQQVFRDSWAAGVVARVFGQGAVGVSFFFVLSGFILTWSARSDDTATSIWRRRAARIIPSHAVTWAFALVGLGLLSSHQFEPWITVSNLFLVQAWVPDQAVYFSLNTPSWSLSCEAFFYALFPVLIKIVSRMPPRSLWPVAAALMAVTLAIPLVSSAVSEPATYWLVFIFPVTRALEFVLGMVMARVVLSGRWIGLKLWHAGVLVVVSYVVSGFLPGAFSYVAGTVVAFALVVAAAAVSDVSERRSILRSRFLLWLGEISFAFYLVHQLVIRFAAKALSSVGGQSPAAPLLQSGLMLVLAVLGAWALHSFVERPMNHLIAGRRRPAGSATNSGRHAAPLRRHRLISQQEDT